MSVYAITPTGNRPEGLALLGEYLNAQTYDGPIEWIIVDDCDPMTAHKRVQFVREGVNVGVIRPEWRWRPGMNTQAQCIARGLEYVPDDATLFVLEDDDIYLPETLSDARRALEGHELVGERRSRYYNVHSGRWRVLTGTRHASLASTVLRGSAIQCLRKVCSSGQKTMLDVTLWQTFDGRKKLTDSNNVIGIKGLPGRPGIGVGHRRTFGVSDDGRVLKQWVGDYARNYDIFRGAA